MGQAYFVFFFLLRVERNFFFIPTVPSGFESTVDLLRIVHFFHFCWLFFLQKNHSLIYRDNYWKISNRICPNNKTSLPFGIMFWRKYFYHPSIDWNIIKTLIVLSARFDKKNCHQFCSVHLYGSFKYLKYLRLQCLPQLMEIFQKIRRFI